MAGLSRITVADLPPRYQAQVAKKLQQVQQKKEAKYHNEKTEVNGIRFDSRKEAKRFEELSYYLEKGYIRNLRLQRDYTLQEAYTKTDGTRVRAIRYRADFTYQVCDIPGNGEALITPPDIVFYRNWLARGGTTVIEDTKGVRTDVYKIKKKMMEDCGYTIREV